MTAPRNAYAAANSLQDLGYDVLDPSFSNVVDVRLWCTRAEVTIEIYDHVDQLAYVYACAEGGQQFSTTDWDDVLSALAADKAHLGAVARSRRPAPPADEDGPVAPYVSEAIYALALALALGCAWTAGLVLLWAVGIALGAWS